MNILRYNPTTGSFGVYADKAAAGNDGIIINSEKELAGSKASSSEMLRAYNQLTGSAIKVFRDKPTAAKRLWDAVQAMAAPEAPKALAPAPKVTKQPSDPKAEAEGRGRRSGTGKFAGKTVFALKEVNPRRAGTAGFASFEIIKGKKEGVPYADYVAAGGRPQDLQWDIDRKWAKVQ